MAFLKKHISTEQKILDLGVTNPFSKRMQAEGYTVENTEGEDLDLDITQVLKTDAEVVTAFEIFEHLVAPFNVLRDIPCDFLVASIPLRLWFAKAYQNKQDPWDRHFHEFEDWQFDWLLEKAGWTIVRREKWNGPAFRIGIRPLLRRLTPRYYAVEEIRS